VIAIAAMLPDSVTATSADGGFFARINYHACSVTSRTAADVRRPLVIDAVIPAHDVAATIGDTLAGLPPRRFRSVIVVDNASSDATAAVARDHGAVVLREREVGYGAACLAALAHLAQLPRPPDVVVFVPGDGSADPADVAVLLAPIIDDNAELVMGVRRFDDGVRPGARTRAAVKLIGTIYRHRFADVGPLRAIRYPALVALGMSDRGDGWNVEMQVRAVKLGLGIVEVPVSARPPSRRRRPGPRAAAQAVGSAGRVLFHILRHSTLR
jgi:glycosyltransferase involved in cell wall biosynthesis